MRLVILSTIVVVLCIISHVSGHSWLTCTDYLEQNGEYWNANLCRAFPRHGHIYTNRNGIFGQDWGYDYIPSGGRACNTQRDDSAAYTTDHPPAVYFPGQKVVITHPTKNHVAELCTNRYIPDHGSKLFVGPRDGQSDPPVGAWNEIADFGRSPYGHEVPDSVLTKYPKPGFQNAPKFCENMDKALATFTFHVPNLAPGRYTFLWAWWFNSYTDGEMYTTCYEIDMVADRASRDRVLNSRGQTTRDPVDISGEGNPTNAPTNAPNPTNDPNPTTGPTNAPTREPPTPRPTPPSSDGVKVSFTDSWSGGANVQILLPNPKPRPYELLATVSFPCAPSHLNIWHASIVTPPDQTMSQLFVFRMYEWQMDKEDIGFTIHFGTCTFKAEDIGVLVN